MSTSAAGKPTARVVRRWAPIRFVRARPWLSVSTVVFVTACVLLSLAGIKPASVLLLSFDLGALLYLSMLARMFTRASAEHMTRQAHAQDTGRRGTLCIAVAVSAVVLVALSTELHAAKNGGATAMGVTAMWASSTKAWNFPVPGSRIIGILSILPS